MAISSPFLTDVDPHAVVKGSRDPMGIQPVWTRLGRRLIGNLTTVSTAVRDFTVLLLGYHLAERVADQAAGDHDLAVFLRWEQLAAYARGEINRDWGFRGTERAKKNLQPPGRVRLGTDTASQILGDQKTYGLWGLYTVPARSSGIVEGEPTRISSVTRRLIDDVYHPILAKGGSRFIERLVDLVAKPRVELDALGRDRGTLETVAKALNRNIASAERDFYTTHLVLGGPNDTTGGAQAVFADVLRSTLGDDDFAWSPQTVRHLAKLASGRGAVGLRVADSLERICTAESVLAPAACLFSFILASDGQTPDDVVSALKKRWGKRVSTVATAELVTIKADLEDAAGDGESGARWVRLGEALAEGDYAVAVAEALAQNAAVMRNRGGAAPWADVRDGRLLVRFREDDSDILPTGQELRTYWRHPYFLDSLRTIMSQVQG